MFVIQSRTKPTHAEVPEVSFLRNFDEIKALACELSNKPKLTAWVCSKSISKHGYNLLVVEIFWGILKFESMFGLNQGLRAVKFSWYQNETMSFALALLFSMLSKGLRLKIFATKYFRASFLHCEDRQKLWKSMSLLKTPVECRSSHAVNLPTQRLLSKIYTLTMYWIRFAVLSAANELCQSKASNFGEALIRGSFVGPIWSDLSSVGLKAHTLWASELISLFGV